MDKIIDLVISTNTTLKTLNEIEKIQHKMAEKGISGGITFQNLLNTHNHLFSATQVKYSVVSLIADLLRVPLAEQVGFPVFHAEVQLAPLNEREHILFITTADTQNTLLKLQVTIEKLLGEIGLIKDPVSLPVGVPIALVENALVERVKEVLSELQNLARLRTVVRELILFQGSVVNPNEKWTPLRRIFFKESGQAQATETEAAVKPDENASIKNYGLSNLWKRHIPPLKFSEIPALASCQSSRDKPIKECQEAFKKGPSTRGGGGPKSSQGGG